MRILGENAFKMRICRQMSRKKLDKMGKSSLKRLVFVYIAFLVAKKHKKFYEIDNKNLLRFLIKYGIIHESDMRRSERLPPTGG